MRLRGGLGEVGKDLDSCFRALMRIFISYDLKCVMFSSVVNVESEVLK